MKTGSRIVLLLAFILALPLSGSKAALPVPMFGTVTMVDLGAKSCIPCKAMAPILVELEKEYKGRAAVVFIDIWEHPEEAKRLKVSIIPTQIFFDRNGREATRHVGFLEKKLIVEQLEALIREK
jgi:thioredoxin 1